MIRVSKSVVGEKEKAAVASILDRGYLGMGPEVQRFEEELKAYMGGEASVICVNTGTAAIHLALQAIGVGPGDEVLVPSLTFVASFQAVAATGATPVACEVHPESGLLDLEDAARRVTPRTKAVLPVHYASQLGNLSALYDFSSSLKLRTVEDAAHAFGCEYQGKKVGSFGDVVCFSFDGIKNITSGEGGAIVTSDPSVIAKAKDGRLLGVQNDTEKRFQGKRSWDFDVTEQGWRFHMSDLMAAIGRVQLSRLENEFAPKRRTLASQYYELLSKNSQIRFLSYQRESGVIPFMLPIRVLGGKRDAVRGALLEHGVEVGIHYKPNHLLSKFRGGTLPKSETLYSELLTLPLHPDLMPEQVAVICQSILRAL